MKSLKISLLLLLVGIVQGIKPASKNVPVYEYGPVEQAPWNNDTYDIAVRVATVKPLSAQSQELQQKFSELFKDYKEKKGTKSANFITRVEGIINNLISYIEELSDREKSHIKKELEIFNEKLTLVSTLLVAGESEKGSFFGRKRTAENLQKIEEAMTALILARGKMDGEIEALRRASKLVVEGPGRAAQEFRQAEQKKFEEEQARIRAAQDLGNVLYSTDLTLTAVAAQKAAITRKELNGVEPDYVNGSATQTIHVKAVEPLHGPIPARQPSPPSSRPRGAAVTEDWVPPGSRSRGAAVTENWVPPGSRSSRDAAVERDLVRFSWK